jgi:hypothetical protein
MVEEISMWGEVESVMPVYEEIPVRAILALTCTCCDEDIFCLVEYIFWGKNYCIGSRG